MARRIDYSARYPQPAERVYAALCDRDQWEARMIEMRKFSENHIEEFDASDTGLTVVVHHVIPRSELPDVAQAVMKKDMVITRKDEYTPFSPADQGTPGATGTFSASIPAGPGSLTGSMALSDTDTGSTLRTSSEAKVYIPFVGGKLEQLMLVNLIEFLRTEATLTADWLQQNA